MIADATFVAIAIVRNRGITARATYWATKQQAALARHIGKNSYEISQLDPGELVAHVVGLLGVTPGRRAGRIAAGPRHRCVLATGTVAGRVVGRHWELATVRMTGSGVAAGTLEAVELDGYLHRVEGETWITLESIDGASVRARIEELFVGSPPKAVP